MYSQSIHSINKYNKLIELTVNHNLLTPKRPGILMNPDHILDT